MTRFLREVMTAALRYRDLEQHRVCAVAFLRYSGVHDDGVGVAAELYCGHATSKPSLVTAGNVRCKLRT
jgi:hypothetical protein